MDDLEKIIRPIVEGQIRGFLKEHPLIVAAVDWYKPRKENKEITFINSLSKRIVRDLLCPTTRARLAAAVLACADETPRKSRWKVLLPRWLGRLELSAGRPSARATIQN